MIPVFGCIGSLVFPNVADGSLFGATRNPTWQNKAQTSSLRKETAQFCSLLSSSVPKNIKNKVDNTMSYLQKLTREDESNRVNPKF